jgi:hypothetical protein
MEAFLPKARPDSPPWTAKSSLRPGLNPPSSLKLAGAAGPEVRRAEKRHESEPQCLRLWGQISSDGPTAAYLVADRHASSSATATRFLGVLLNTIPSHDAVHSPPRSSRPLTSSRFRPRQKTLALFLPAVTIIHHGQPLGALWAVSAGQRQLPSLPRIKSRARSRRGLPMA